MDKMFLPLRRYAVFEGRADRSEFWFFLLFVVSVQFLARILIWFLGGDLEHNPFGSAASGIVALAYFGFCLYALLPSLAVTVRPVARH